MVPPATPIASESTPAIKAMNVRLRIQSDFLSLSVSSRLHRLRGERKYSSAPHYAQKIHALPVRVLLAQSL
jgi:hypothetical protein